MANKALKKYILKNPNKVIRHFTMQPYFKYNIFSSLKIDYKKFPRTYALAYFAEGQIAAHGLLKDILFLRELFEIIKILKTEYLLHTMQRKKDHIIQNKRKEWIGKIHILYNECILDIEKTTNITRKMIEQPLRSK